MARQRNARRCSAPCPGCKTPDKYRFADEVCTDCKNAMAEARALRADVERRANADMVAVGVPESAHWLPYIGEGDRSAHAEIQESLVKLARAVGHLITIEVERGSMGYRYSSQETSAEVDRVELIKGQHCSMPPVYLLPREAHEAIVTLYEGIKKVAHTAHQTGHQEGRDLLMSMHAGTITLDEMEARAGIADRTYEEKKAGRR